MKKIEGWQRIEILGVSDEGGNYEKELAKLVSSVKRGGVYDVAILHDDWCDLLSDKGACNCTPETVMTELKSDEEDQAS
jgi:hypothetical protein